MRTQFAIKRGDLWPSLICAIPGTWNEPLPDVTGATAHLLVRAHGATGQGTQMPGAVTLSRVGSTLRFAYPWQDGDTDAEADWDAEFKVTLADGRTWSVPGTDRNGGAVYLRVRVIDGLGDADAPYPEPDPDPDPDPDAVSTIGFWVSTYPGVFV